MDKQISTMMNQLEALIIQEIGFESYSLSNIKRALVQMFSYVGPLMDAILA